MEIQDECTELGENCCDGDVGALFAVDVTVVRGGVCVEVGEWSS